MRIMAQVASKENRWRAHREAAIGVDGQHAESGSMWDLAT
jgi:hypothetical protein